MAKYLPGRNNSAILRKYTFYPLFMANEENITPPGITPQESTPTPGGESSFVSSIANQKPESAYSDFFQETSDGQISV